MLGRLAEKLVVPETDGTSEQLTGWTCNFRMPEEVVKTFTQTPGAQCVKEYGIRLSGLIGVVFVPEFVACMTRQEEFVQLGPQPRDLFVVEYADASEVPVLVEELQLFPGQFNVG
jgi:hypothetical protein